MKANKTYSVIPYRGKILKLSNLESGRVFYKNYFLDLSTNKKVRFNILDWIESLDSRISTFYNQIKVIHLFYELSFIIENIDSDISEDAILAIDLTYKDFDKLKLSSRNKINLEKIASPSFKDYEQKFLKGREELILGNCYQFNLTEKYIFKFENVTPIQFIENLWENKKNRGAFASATCIPLLQKLFLSNSPECLFKIENENIFSMPIKGTIKLDSENDIDRKWTELINDRKCESELFMITDLIRNDLSRIDQPKAEVTKLKEKLIVPGLLHQYSEIKCPLNDFIKLKDILKKIFPGGSITGAPKKRVIKILNNLESRNRGFYCGSTVIMFKELKAASINIRSSEIDFKKSELSYQAGGGVTIKSKVIDEYQEMSYKVSSFIDILTL